MNENVRTLLLKTADMESLSLTASIVCRASDRDLAESCVAGMLARTAKAGFELNKSVEEWYWDQVRDLQDSLAELASIVRGCSMELTDVVLQLGPMQIDYFAAVSGHECAIEAAEMCLNAVVGACGAINSAALTKQMIARNFDDIGREMASIDSESWSQLRARITLESRLLERQEPNGRAGRKPDPDVAERNRKIVERFRAGETQAVLAEYYDLHPSYISRIVPKDC